MAIENVQGGTIFTGEDVKVYQAITVSRALRLWLKGIVVSRRATLSGMLATASTITDKPYKNTRAGTHEAIDDLQKFIIDRRLERA